MKEEFCVYLWLNPSLASWQEKAQEHQTPQVTTNKPPVTFSFIKCHALLCQSFSHTEKDGWGSEREQTDAVPCQLPEPPRLWWVWESPDFVRCHTCHTLLSHLPIYLLNKTACVHCICWTKQHKYVLNKTELQFFYAVVSWSWFNRAVMTFTPS